ncbi:hypothetical protein DRJ17_04105 [Candidatus Woesearchaeota archaeon]|nr:MAG: hypothetical protein DRJ17_04105 [Candidatus Woesearchaeota archaeon]
MKPLEVKCDRCGEAMYVELVKQKENLTFIRLTCPKCNNKEFTVIAKCKKCDMQMVWQSALTSKNYMHIHFLCFNCGNKDFVVFNPEEIFR